MTNIDTVWATRLTCIIAALSLMSCAQPREGNQLKLEDLRSSLQSLCAQARVEIRAPISGNGFLVDRSFVGTGHTRVMYLEDYLRWMLDRQLSYIEVPFVPSNSYLDWNGWDQGSEEKPFVRLSLKPAGHPACTSYVKWTSQYPAQKLPWLRKAGVSASLCIGFERVDDPASRFEVQTATTLIQPTQNQFGLERYDFVVRDRQTRTVVGEATLPISTVWEHRDILCGKQALFNELVNALVPVPDSRYVHLTVVPVQTSEFINGGTASDQLLDTFRWNGSVNRDNVSNIVSADGTAWVEPIYAKMLQGYSLTLVDGDKLFKTPVIRAGRHVGWLTGIGLSANSVATIAVDTTTRAAELLLFSKQGEPQAVYALSANQLERLQGKP